LANLIHLRFWLLTSLIFYPTWLQEEETYKQGLLEANKMEDKLIKTLEKNLKLNKRKGNKIATAFVKDGLDCILSIC